MLIETRNITRQLDHLRRRIYPQDFLKILLAGLLVLAIIIAPNYGQSWDDEFDSDTGNTALRAYRGDRGYFETHDQRFYGPIYFMFSEIIVQIFHKLNLSWHEVDIRHLLNATTFLLASQALFRMGRLVFSPWTSLVITLMFASQPLLFGHAFINQKDIPFMAAALWTMALGLEASGIGNKGRSRLSEQEGSKGGDESELGTAWNSLPRWRRSVIILFIVSAGLILIDLALGLLSLQMSQQMLAEMYAGTACSPLQNIFQQVASDAFKTPFIMYEERLEQVFLWARIPFGIMIAGVAFYLARLVAPGLHKKFRNKLDPYRSWILPGAILGIATGIRVPGIFFGALVGLHAIWTDGKQKLFPLLVYGTTAGITLYLTWPFLWEAPFDHFLETVRVMGNFPAHDVLYRGEIISSRSLPWHYLPTLLGIQITLPALLLIGAGTIIAVLPGKNVHTQRIGILLLIWAFFPMSYFIVMKTPLYGNFRQLLFLLPAMFLLSGFIIERIAASLPQTMARVAFTTLLLLPGIIGILRLHPYEYTYYNRLVGGTEQVYGEYELDYWCTSYREIAEFLNHNAETGEIAVVTGPEYGVRNFITRAIFIIPDWQEAERVDYAVACEKALLFDYYSDLPVIHSIHRGSAIYGLVRGEVEK